MACGTLTGLSVTVLYLVVYSLTLVLFFDLILNTRCLINEQPLIYLSDFAKLNTMRFFGLKSLIIVLFSMGGIPPLAGFFIKLYIYMEAISSGFYIFVILSLIITIVSTFYYLFFLRSIFFDNSTWSKLSYLRSSSTLSGFIDFTISLFLISFIFVNSYIYHFFFLYLLLYIHPFIAILQYPLL